VDRARLERMNWKSTTREIEVSTKPKKKRRERAKGRPTTEKKRTRRQKRKGGSRRGRGGPEMKVCRKGDALQKKSKVNTRTWKPARVNMRTLGAKTHPREGERKKNA